MVPGLWGCRAVRLVYHSFGIRGFFRRRAVTRGVFEPRGNVRVGGYPTAASISNMKATVTRDPEIMHGAACFAGTRVTVQTFFDHLEGGYTVAGFLEQFPSVRAEQVTALLRELRAEADRSAVAASA